MPPYPPYRGVRLDGGVDDTPLYDATLGSVLARMRAQAQQEAQQQAQAEIQRVRREYELRQVLAAEQAEHLAQQRAEEAVRAALVSGAPVLVELAAVTQEEGDEPTAPPVPPFSELLTSSKRLDSFFDALLGP